jgi:hypothetical protein
MILIIAEFISSSVSLVRCGNQSLNFQTLLVNVYVYKSLRDSVLNKVDEVCVHYFKQQWLNEIHMRRIRFYDVYAAFIAVFNCQLLSWPLINRFVILHRFFAEYLLSEFLLILVVIITADKSVTCRVFKDILLSCHRSRRMHVSRFGSLPWKRNFLFSCDPVKIFRLYIS